MLVEIFCDDVLFSKEMRPADALGFVEAVKRFGFEDMDGYNYTFKSAIVEAMGTLSICVEQKDE